MGNLRLIEKTCAWVTMAHKFFGGAKQIASSSTCGFFKASEACQNLSLRKIHNMVERDFGLRIILSFPVNKP